MRIIESYIKSKTPIEKECEDEILINNNYIAVIDGVSSKSKVNNHSGNLAKEAICNVLNNTSSDICAIELFNDFSYEIKKVNKINNCCAKAVCTVYSKYHKQIWNYGDCKIMINGKLYDNESKIDQLISDLRSMIIEFLLVSKSVDNIGSLLENDKSRAMILPFLNIQSSFENNNVEYGYPVLNGDSINLAYLKKFKVKNNDEVVISTDGYPLLCKSLKLSEEKLKDFLANDPLCYKLHKSTKGKYNKNDSFDDRAYVRFTV